VNTADLFRDNRITMLNFWGTWCPNCVNEMKELAEIHTRLREKGCGVVGVEMEKKPIEEIREKALALLAEKGTNYPSVLFPNDFATFDFINTFPTTLFVDSEGNVLTYPIIGALVDEYEKTVDELLAGEAPQAAAPGAAVTEGATGEYHVIVTDSEGPVKGVTVQFCDDVTCSFQKTDENGVATFTPETAKVYDVHILKVPDGYAEDETVYNTLDTWSDLSITIEKAG
jgi:thiol-disulfide isomerase/thioredoxin